MVSLYMLLMKRLKKVGHYGDKLRGIVFCSDRNEAKTVCGEFNNLGIHTEVVISDNNTDDEKVSEYIERLENHNKDDISLLCVVDKFNEGIDIPEVNIIIMLRPTTSSIIFYNN